MVSQDEILTLTERDGLTQCFVVSDSEIICSNTSTGNKFLNLPSDVNLTSIKDIEIKGKLCHAQKFSDSSSGFQFGILTSEKNNKCIPSVYNALKDFDSNTAEF